MKGSDQFKEAIKSHLDDRASNDPLFAKSYAKECKTIDGCVQYILGEVQKSGRNGFADDEIYGMAVHYYDEDDLKTSKHTISAVVVNTPIEKQVKEPKPKKAKPQSEPQPIIQGSLF